ncbi:hypothetical protein NN561_015288 [Cricetulus griseus]
MADLGSERSPLSRAEAPRGAVPGGRAGGASPAGVNWLGGSRQLGVRIRKCPKPFCAHGLLAGSGSRSGPGGGRPCAAVGKEKPAGVGIGAAHPPAADRRRRQT